MTMLSEFWDYSGGLYRLVLGGLYLLVLGGLYLLVIGRLYGLVLGGLYRLVLGHVIDQPILDWLAVCQRGERLVAGVHQLSLRLEGRNLPE